MTDILNVVEVEIILTVWVMAGYILGGMLVDYSPKKEDYDQA